MSSPRLVRTRPSLQTAARLVGTAVAIELINGSWLVALCSRAGAVGGEHALIDPMCLDFDVPISGEQLIHALLLLVSR